MDPDPGGGVDGVDFGLETRENVIPETRRIDELHLDLTFRCRRKSRAKEKHSDQRRNSFLFRFGEVPLI